MNKTRLVLLQELGEKLQRCKDRTAKFIENKAPKQCITKELWIATRYEARIWVVEHIKLCRLANFLQEVVRIIMTNPRITIDNQFQRFINWFTWTRIGRYLSMCFLQATSFKMADEINKDTEENDIVIGALNFLVIQKISYTMMIDALLLPEEWKSVNEKEIAQIMRDMQNIINKKKSIRIPRSKR